MSPSRVNLNSLAPRAAGDFLWEKQDRSTSSASVTVHFGDVATAAEEFIEASPMLVGCVAWVKSRRLVAALAARPVALVVNKEFGLRVQGHPEREALTPLVAGIASRYIPSPTPRETLLEAVRCVGWAAKGKFGALMHHKFLVRLDASGRPTAVWTGSFNLTAGAEGNIENGLVITDPAIARAFLKEFARVWALSEPLLFKAGTPTPGSQAKVPVRVPAPKRAAPKRKPARKPAAKKTTAATARKPAVKKTTAARKPATTRKPRSTK
jgi:phosphatidylserine/phosphatidylglycerophosphate/cardiolipin synthase-like enzyme